MIELTVDPIRSMGGCTGIFVRAKFHEMWGSHDIAELDKKSLPAWLRSHNGDNKLAENVVGILLGHGSLHEPSCL